MVYSFSVWTQSLRTLCTSLPGSQPEAVSPGTPHAGAASAESGRQCRKVEGKGKETKCLRWPRRSPAGRPGKAGDLMTTADAEGRLAHGCRSTRRRRNKALVRPGARARHRSRKHGPRVRALGTGKEAPSCPRGAGATSSPDRAHGTWMRRLWQMSHVFMVSGYVSLMYCSISRMARLCRVNSPSFCGDTRGKRALRPPARRALPPLLSTPSPLQPTAQNPERRKGLASGGELRQGPERKVWTLPTDTLCLQMWVTSLRDSQPTMRTGSRKGAGPPGKAGKGAT